MTWRHRLIIVLLAFAAYGSTLRLPFLYDDHYVIEAQAPTSFTIADVRHDFQTGLFGDPQQQDFYRPVLRVLHRAEFFVWGLSPFGYRLVNLGIHTINSLLLAECLVALGMSTLTAFVAACFFAMQPLILSELLMASGRTEVLSFFFMLLTLLSWLSGRWRVSVIFYGLALFTKESAVMTPFLLVLCAWYCSRWKTEWRQFLPHAGLTILYLFWYGYLFGARWASPPLGLWLRFFIQAFPSVLWCYAGLAIWPWSMHTDRVLPALGPIWLFGSLGLAGVIGVLLYRRHRLGLFCMAWFILPFLPKTLLMVRESFMYDHWIYPSLPGLLLPAAVLLVYFQKSVDTWKRWVSGGVAVFWLCLWSVMIHAHVLLRNTDEKFYRWACRFPTSVAMPMNLANVLIQQHRYSEALQALQQAQTRAPEDPNIRQAIAVLSQALQKSH